MRKMAGLGLVHGPTPPFIVSSRLPYDSPMRVGLRVNTPSQFGHLKWISFSVQFEQKVHSNEQMNAFSESSGSSAPHFSHLFLISNINFTPSVLLPLRLAEEGRHSV